MSQGSKTDLDLAMLSAIVAFVLAEQQGSGEGADQGVAWSRAAHHRTRSWNPRSAADSWRIQGRTEHHR